MQTYLHIPLIRSYFSFSILLGFKLLITRLGKKFDFFKKLSHCFAAAELAAEIMKKWKYVSILAAFCLYSAENLRMLDLTHFTTKLTPLDPFRHSVLSFSHKIIINPSPRNKFLGSFHLVN